MNNRKLYHPLWTHIPALLALAGIIYAYASAAPLPARVPVHYGITGRPDRWGSPWESALVTIVLAAVLIGVSVMLDELWARQETRKHFNWLSLFDEISVGLMLSVTLGYVPAIKRGAETLDVNWPVTVGVMAAAVALAAILELARPFIPHPQHYRPEDTSGLEAEIGAFTEEGRPWSYSDVQNPAWMGWLIAGAAAFMLFAAIMAYAQSPWLSLLVVLLAAALILPYGGLRTTVNPERLIVRMGIWGIRLLNLPLSQIADARLHQFSPLREFGGYGIRFNREMKAYFFSGNRGVLITTSEGKKYLIGSDHPEKLEAVIRVATRMAGG